MQWVLKLKHQTPWDINHRGQAEPGEVREGLALDGALNSFLF